MKYIFLILILLFCFTCSEQIFAQNTTEILVTKTCQGLSLDNDLDTDNLEIVVETNKVYTTVEQMPQFVGGYSEMFKYIGATLKYPDVGCAHISGRVVLRFIIEKDGSISNAEILRSLHPAFDKEAIRVIESMPKWIPGKQDGKSVRTYFIMPIILN